MSLSHRKKDITMYAKILQVLKNIMEIMLSRILLAFNFWYKFVFFSAPSTFRRPQQIFCSLGVSVSWWHGSVVRMSVFDWRTFPYVWYMVDMWPLCV